MLSPLKAAALLLALLATTPASAIYRCGNVFQDRPCSNSAEQVRLGPSGQPVPSAAPATPAAQAASPFAAACARQGQDAQRVAWKREAGATQEMQLAELPANGARDEMTAVIASVYTRRGSAPEIRAAVEAECLVEKKKQSDAAAALQALTEQAGKKNGVPAATTAAPATEAGIPALPKAGAAAGKPDPRAACPGLRSQEESLKDQMRTGGSAATMERYNAQRRQLDKQLLDARC